MLSKCGDDFFNCWERKVWVQIRMDTDEADDRKLQRKRRNKRLSHEINDYVMKLIRGEMRDIKLNIAGEKVRPEGIQKQT